MCDVPPHRKNKIVDFACSPDVAAADSVARDGVGRPNWNPAPPTADATKNVRRSSFDMFYRLIIGLCRVISRRSESLECLGTRLPKQSLRWKSEAQAQRNNSIDDNVRLDNNRQSAAVAAERRRVLPV